MLLITDMVPRLMAVTELALSGSLRGCATDSPSGNAVCTRVSLAAARHRAVYLSIYLAVYFTQTDTIS